MRSLPLLDKAQPNLYTVLTMNNLLVFAFVLAIAAVAMRIAPRRARVAVRARVVRRRKR